LAADFSPLSATFSLFLLDIFYGCGKVLSMESKDIPIIEDIPCDLCGRTRAVVKFSVPDGCVECWDKLPEFTEENCKRVCAEAKMVYEEAMIGGA
jgi:hypothetical protein